MKNSVDKQRYEALLMRCKDAETQKKEFEEQLKKAEEKNSVLESSIRKLCESILCRDRSEMQLGGNYNWRNLSAQELISKAAASHKRYNEERTDVMKRTLDLAEERRSHIEGLEDQIKRLLLENEMLRASQEGEVDTITSPVAPTPKSTTEQAAASNDKPVEKNSELPTVQTEYIIDDDAMGTIEQAKELIGLNEQAKVNEHSIPIFETQAKIENKKKARQEAVDAYMVDLKQYEKRFTPAMWSILEAIGSKGISVGQAIEEYVAKNVPDVTNTKIRIGIITLVNMDAISESGANTPLYPRRRAFRLTQIGAKLYKNKFAVEAITSELERIIAEHDNAQHGYGILDIQEVLINSKKYDGVSIWNRSKAIKISQYSTYIPDIIAKSGSRTEYIEYERGTHTQEDFSAKCNKMCQVTRFLHFVVPSAEVLNNRIIPQIQKWMETKGKESLSNISIKVSAARYLKEHNPGTRECWQVIFKSGNPEPIFS